MMIRSFNVVRAPRALACIVLCLSAGIGAAAENDTSPPTFNDDVAPIFYEHCVSCHKAGEVAPMSLLTYDEARPWAKSIAKAVSDGAMPPWHADSTQVAYANDRSLAEEEIETVVAWARSGAPRGEGEAPAPPALPEGWLLGEPDMVFETKQPFLVPATDEEIPYQSLTFHIDLDEDVYVEAWELRPWVLGAVHHANLVRAPSSLDGKSVGIASAVMVGGDYIGSYLPGHSWVRYAEGQAYRLPKGSHLGIQVHYVSVGAPVEDTIRFGIHLADGRVDKLVRVVGTDYRDLNIPPGEPHYEVVDEVEVLYDMYALTSGVHMHLRGSAFRMEAARPDGSVALITDVPHYDFNWQSNYVLQDPVFMPKGTKLRVTTAWDNSAENPYNPAPEEWVRYGPWTDDEMVNAWAHVVLADEKLGLKLEDGRIVGRFDDGVEATQPFLIQSLPQAPSFQKNKQEFESHEPGGEE